MPQASNKTAVEYEKHFGGQDESAGYAYLRGIGIQMNNGLFYGGDDQLNKIRADTKAAAALHYLCEEFDYGWDFTGRVTELGVK